MYPRIKLTVRFDLERTSGQRLNKRGITLFNQRYLRMSFSRDQDLHTVVV